MGGQARNSKLDSAKINILIVEDDPCYREKLESMYRRLLNDAGEVVDVRLAEDGNQAIEIIEAVAIKEVPFDILSLDIELGDMAKIQEAGANGESVARIAAAKRRCKSAVVISACSQSATLSRAVPETKLQQVRAGWVRQIDRHFPGRTIAFTKLDDPDATVAAIEKEMSGNDLLMLCRRVNCFYRQGDRFQIVFNGKETTVRDLLGFRYVHYLLENRDTGNQQGGISALELVRHLNPKEEAQLTREAEKQWAEEEERARRFNSQNHKQKKDSEEEVTQTLKNVLKAFEESLRRLVIHRETSGDSSPILGELGIQLEEIMESGGFSHEQILNIVRRHVNDAEDLVRLLRGQYSTTVASGRTSPQEKIVSKNAADSTRRVIRYAINQHLRKGPAKLEDLASHFIGVGKRDGAIFFGGRLLYSSPAKWLTQPPQVII